MVAAYPDSLSLAAPPTGPRDSAPSAVTVELAELRILQRERWMSNIDLQSHPVSLENDTVSFLSYST